MRSIAELHNNQEQSVVFEFFVLVNGTKKLILQPSFAGWIHPFL